jgi:uncharacterized protein
MPEQVSFPAASAEPAPGLGPTRPRDRIEVIDILRGFALFGVLLVNITLDQPWYYLFEGTWPGVADRLAVQLIDFFANGKFITLFSFLFGLGFALQMQRAETRQARFLPIYARRLGLLLLIGMVHSILWWGDILLPYALLGFLLLLFRRFSARTILGVALVLMLLNPARTALDAGLRELRLAHPETARAETEEMVREQIDERALRKESFRVYSQASFGDVLALRTRELGRRLTSLQFYLLFLGAVFPVFLLGLYAGRRRIFQNIPQHLPFIRKLFRRTLGLGLVGMSVDLVFGHLVEHPALPYVTQRVVDVFWVYGTRALSISYACALILLFQRPAWQTRLAPLAAAGRTALSNYLLQTVAYVTLFNSFGFGLYGKVGPLGGVALAFLIFPLQVLLSVWWMRRFRFGPAEWLWRTLTYGKLQPMRVSSHA